MATTTYMCSRQPVQYQRRTSRKATVFSPCIAPSPPLAKIREHCSNSRVKSKPVIFSHHLICTVFFTAVFRQHTAVVLHHPPAELSERLSRNLQSHIFFVPQTRNEYLALLFFPLSCFSPRCPTQPTMTPSRPLHSQATPHPQRGVDESLQFWICEAVPADLDHIN